MNYTSAQIIGYDSEGNPIIGDPNTSTTVNVNSSIDSLDGILDSLTELPNLFFSGFVNLFLNGEPKGGLQMAGSIACWVRPGAAARALAPKVLYHFTSAESAALIRESGFIQPGEGLFGPGVYGSAINSAIAARLMGAASNEVSVPFSAGLGTVPSACGPLVVPGAYRVTTPISILPTVLGRVRP